MNARWRRYVRPLRANPHVDVDDELRFHIEMRTQDLIAAGVDPHAARAEAERLFGAVLPVRDACLTIDQRRQRRAARADRMSALLQDIRYALRSIRLTPAFSAVVTITLALGIGATTTMYGVVDGVLLRPLPYPTADRLVALNALSVSTGDAVGSSFPEFKDWKQRSAGTFDEIGAWYSSGATLVDGDRPEMLAGERMSAAIPRMLGVKPVIGRFFTDADDAANAERLVVLSEAFWRERFAGDPSVLGRTLQLSGRAYTVIGVFPSGPMTRLPNELKSGRDTHIWLSLRLGDSTAPRGLQFLDVMARLAPGVPLARARSAVAAMSHALVSDSVSANGILVSPVAELLTKDSRRPLALLLGAVTLLLLIACANVANLLLARASTRGREFAIRLALGAGRGRLVSQLLAESVVRAATGGVLGVALALGATWWMRTRLSITLPRFEMVAIDTRVLAFAVVVSVATGLLFGLVPALRAARGTAGDALREGGRGVAGSMRRDRFRRALIVGEMALSFVLLIAAALCIRSLRNVLAVPRGFDPSQVVSASVSLPSVSYPDADRQRAFYAQLLERVGALPGVQRVALSSSLPIEGGVNGTIGIDGRTFPPDASPVVEKRIVSAGYLQAMNASLARGRLFAPTDTKDARAVVVVNETFAKRWFPNENPIGKRIDFSWDTQGLQTIVGVIADMHENPLNQKPVGAVYIPVEQRAHSGMYLVVRGSGDPSSVVPAVRATLRSLDRRLPLIQVRTFDDIVSRDTASQRLTTSIFAVFASLALVLAAVGLYGVISYSVVQRTQELGIRAALGARRADLMRLVLLQSAGFTFVGIALGALGAIAGGRLLASQLFGVAPSDPATFVLVALLLAAVATLASALPALRATRADPLVALRQE